MSDKRHSFWKTLGPGIIFAGAAIGNSHLVQSTRAGALFGFGLLSIVLFANLLKYPAMRFGPQYAAATGQSLVSGYRRLGRWVVALFALSEVFVMAIIVAASALTTAAIGVAIGGVGVDARYMAIVFAIIGAVILRMGGYSLLENMAKLFVAILTVTTLIATAMAVPNIDWRWSAFAPPNFDFKTFAFVIALMGFMPATVSLSVLQSLWVVAKTKNRTDDTPFGQTLLDFNIGYIGTTVLAVCFLTMGAGILHPSGIVPEQNGGAFAAQVISLYTTSLGDWSGIVVGASAMMVMFTTLVTLLDGFPRTLAACVFAFMGKRDAVAPRIDGTRTMTAATLLIVAGAVVILLFFMRNFREFIDFVTTTAFVVAPISAILNHLVICGADVPAERRPGRLLLRWSMVSIILLCALTLVYLFGLRPMA